MLKKALATAGVAAAIVSAGASTALAAPQQDEPADTVDICNAPTQANPDEKDSYTGVNGKEGILPPLTVGDQKLSVIAGLCSTAKAEKGEGGEETPAPGGEQGGDSPSFPSAL